MEKNDFVGKKKDSKRTLLIVLCVVLAVILVLLIAATAYMESLFNLIGREPENKDEPPISYDDFYKEQEQEDVDPNFQGEVVNPDDIDWSQITDPIENSENIINIMLIGQDRRPGEGRARSDVMLLCTINRETEQLIITSFMRDMYVQIPGFWDDKMNAAYQVGGMEALDACLEKNFGILVDGNVEVDFNGFIGLIDLVGGVEMELTAAEAKYLNNETGLQTDSGSSGWSLTEGKNQLNGGQALGYARIRKIGDGDFDRTDRQRKVIAALIDKCKDMNLTQMKELLEEALPLLTTDLTDREILSYMVALLPMFTNLEIQTQRIPADGTYRYAWIREMSVLLPDLEANREILKNCMG